MYFYLFGLLISLADCFICKVKGRPYDLKESLVSLSFYTVDMWFVLIAIHQLDLIGRVSRSIWHLKYGFLQNLSDYFTSIIPRLESLESTWIKYVLLFVLVDFTYYWIHRASHEVGILWTQHAVHHSTTRLNFLATQRNAFRFTTINLPLVFFVIPMLFSFNYASIALCFAFLQSYQTLIHSEWIPRFWRPLELVFNTPWHHRIHHSIEHSDRPGNYGGTLIIFDRIFGTLVELPDQNFSYGVPGFKITHNPLRLNFQYWIKMFQDMATSGSLKDSLLIAFTPTSTHRFFKKNGPPLETNRPA